MNATRCRAGSSSNARCSANRAPTTSPNRGPDCPSSQTGSTADSRAQVPPPTAFSVQFTGHVVQDREQPRSHRAADVESLDRPPSPLPRCRQHVLSPARVPTAPASGSLLKPRRMPAVQLPHSPAIAASSSGHQLPVRRPSRTRLLSHVRTTPIQPWGNVGRRLHCLVGREATNSFLSRKEVRLSDDSNNFPIGSVRGTHGLDPRCRRAQFAAAAPRPQVGRSSLSSGRSPAAQR